MGNISGIGSIHNCFNVLKASVFDKPSSNFFDIKSNKKLGYVLQHGYSFRHHERKHFNVKKSVDAYRRANQEFLNLTIQNRSMMDGLQPKSGQKLPRQINMSASSQNLYADLFTDRYRKLTQSIMDELQDSSKNLSAKKEEGVSEVRDEVSNAKVNRVYKELGLNLNLKEIFGGLNSDELMKLKKLHVLYATQRGSKNRGREGVKEAKVVTK